VNGVSFFAPQIFAGVNALGSGNQGSLIAAVIVNGVQLIATIITVFIVDRVGRRTLLISGSVLGFAAEIAVAIVFAVAAGKNAVDLPFGASIAAIVLVSVRPLTAASCLVSNPPVHSCFNHTFIFDANPLQCTCPLQQYLYAALLSMSGLPAWHKPCLHWCCHRLADLLGLNADWPVLHFLWICMGTHRMADPL